MGLIDKLQPYLGTKTILIIDKEEHWLEIYDKLRSIDRGFTREGFRINTVTNPLCISLKQKGLENRVNLNYYKENYPYKNYKFIHTSELIKKLEFNNWLWQ